MPYTFNNSDGSVSTTVADSTIDTSSYALALVGRNVSNYGLYFAQNAVRQLENFASATAPSASTTLRGQVWYDKTEDLLRVYDGTRWKRSTGIVVGTSEPTTNLAAGTAWFNTTDDKLRVYDGSLFRFAGYAGEVSNAYQATTNIGSPSNYGTKLRNIFLKDSTGVDRAVLALTYANDSASPSVNVGSTVTNSGAETIMAIFSDHAQFTAANSNSNTEGEDRNWYAELVGTGGIGAIIRPGLNLRTEYDTTSLALSQRAYRADAAYRLNLGNVGADGANVSATEVIHTGRSYIPDATNTYNIGSSSFRFADSFTGTLYVGNGTTGAIIGAGNVAIGNSSSRISTIHTHLLNVSSNVSFATGTATDAVTTATPNTLVLRDSAGSFAANVITSTFSGDGASLTGLNANNISSGTISNGRTTATSSITANTIVLRDSSGSFTANVVTAVASSARYADLAEIYASDDDYAPGTVVKLGGSAEITQTTSIEDLNVFGVISTDPAYLMNSEAEGLPVALTGRVPVKVVGTVLKGERLICSHLPGVAMALGFKEYDPRKIIGRSLEQKTTDDLDVVEAVIGVK